MDLAQLVDVDQALNGNDGDQVERCEHHECAPDRHKAHGALPCAPPGIAHLCHVIIVSSSLRTDKDLKVAVRVPGKHYIGAHSPMHTKYSSLLFKDAVRYTSSKEWWNFSKLHGGVRTDAPEVAPHDFMRPRRGSDLPGAGIMMLGGADSLRL